MEAADRFTHPGAAAPKSAFSSTSKQQAGGFLRRLGFFLFLALPSVISCSRQLVYLGQNLDGNVPFHTKLIGRR